MKQILKLGGTLALYATVACVCLAFVHLATQPVIQKHEEEKLAQNLKVVFPDGERFEDITTAFVLDYSTKTGSTKLEKAYCVYKTTLRPVETTPTETTTDKAEYGILTTKTLESTTPETLNEETFAEETLATTPVEELAGMIIQASGPTYAESTVLVAITPDGVIKNLRITKTSDTSGLGSKSTLPSFYEQFSGKSTKGPFIAHQGIEAISGATITTNGIGKILQGICDSATDYFSKNLSQEDSTLQNTTTEILTSESLSEEEPLNE